ncbi:MAG: photoactive yellow protein [Alphaproteobacteria bacterium]
MEIVKFGSSDVENLLAQDPSRVENLPFGAILVDKQGNILKYNQQESFISGRSAEAVLGKNFFNDVAPCAKGHQFQQRFQQAVSTGHINTVFEYTFDYKMEPTKVRVHMKSTSANDGIWILIKRL